MNKNYSADGADRQLFKCFLNALHTFVGGSRTRCFLFCDIRLPHASPSHIPLCACAAVQCRLVPLPLRHVRGPRGGGHPVNPGGHPCQRVPPGGGALEDFRRGGRRPVSSGVAGVHRYLYDPCWAAFFLHLGLPHSEPNCRIIERISMDVARYCLFVVKNRTVLFVV